MFFTSPFWLLALLPWGAVTAWLLWGRRKREPVPFLALWQGPVTSRRSTRSLQTPPLALALAVLAMLLAIVGAARPMLRFLDRASMSQPMTLVVDRGITMSARRETSDDSRKLEFVALSELAAPLLREQLGHGPVQLIDVPSGKMRMYDSQTWVEHVRQLPPTAVDTAAQLRAVVAQQLHDSTGAVIVLSDQPIDVQSPRLVQIAPDGAPENVGLVRVAASLTPVPQVMAEVRNQSGQSEAMLRITSGGHTIDTPIHLPPRNAQKNYFQNLTKIDDVIDVKLLVKDDLTADNEAWLVREHHHPKIEVRSPISPALRRMIEVYERNKPPSADDPPLPVVQSPGEIGPQEGGIFLAALGGSGRVASTSAGAAPVVADHPVTATVDWSKVAENAIVASQPPHGQGWTPVVRFGGRSVVAVREAPRREVWVGFDSPTWSRTGDYVVFWTNVFDWLGGGTEGEDFIGHPIAALGPEWRAVQLASADDNPGDVHAIPGLWPGLYELADHSATRAVNALNVQLRSPLAQPYSWRAKLTAIARNVRPSFDVAPFLLLLAAVCVMLAAMTWRRSTSTISAADIATGTSAAKR